MFFQWERWRWDEDGGDDNGRDYGDGYKSGDGANCGNVIMVVTRMVVVMLWWRFSNVCSFQRGSSSVYSDCYQEEIIIKQLHITGMEWCKARALTTLTPLSQEFNNNSTN
jgi:hypothetical protein